MSSETVFRQRKDSPFPMCTVDIIIKVDNKIVLIERKYPPSGWAIPGGFVEKGESLEDAAVREAKEETGLDLTDLRQFHAYSDPKRDSRFHTISVVFTAVSSGKPEADTDASKAGLFDLDKLPENLAFDHSRILKDYREYSAEKARKD